MKKVNFIVGLSLISTVLFLSHSQAFTTYPITIDSTDDEHPKIGNNGYVAWTGYDGSDNEIFLYDGLSTTQITDNTYDDLDPHINDNGLVVWEGPVGGADSEIFLYNGSSTTRLTDNPTNDDDPRVNNSGRVV